MKRGFLFTVESLFAISVVIFAASAIMIYSSGQEGAYLGDKDRNSMDYAMMERYALETAGPAITTIVAQNYVCEKLYKYNITSGIIDPVNKCSVIN